MPRWIRRLREKAEESALTRRLKKQERNDIAALGPRSNYVVHAIGPEKMEQRLRFIQNRHHLTREAAMGVLFDALQLSDPKRRKKK